MCIDLAYAQGRNKRWLPVEKRAVFVRPGPLRSDPGPITRGGGRAGEGARPDQSALGPRRQRQTNTT